MVHSRFTFTNPDGQTLSARLDAPVAPRAYALFAHCFACGKDIKAAYWIARSLAELGIGVVRFDFAGLGDSEGEFSDTGFASNVADLVAAAEHMTRSLDAPAILIGHSLGGAAVLAAAERIPSAKAVVTIGAPSQARHLEQTLRRLAPELEAGQDAEIRVGGRKLFIKQAMLEELAKHDGEQSVANLKRALLVMHAPRDTIVSIDHAGAIYSAAKHPKSFISLDDADHLLSKGNDARYAAQMLSAWVSRYLPERSSDSLPDGAVRVTGGPSGFANEVRVGRHVLAADEPVDIPGGTDTGPSPYDYLLAGLGACTSMTLRMYANRKGLSVDRIQVDLSHERVHAKDCEECESDDGYVSVIRRSLTVEGDLTPDQRTRLTEISEKCPVHRTLTNEILIRST